MAKDRLVLVVWEDITNIAEWMTRDHMEEWAQAKGWICRNVGWLTYEDKDCIVVSSRKVQDEERHVGLSERIPKRAILELHKLKEDSSGQVVQSKVRRK
jgi:hypothetical protein